MIDTYIAEKAECDITVYLSKTKQLDEYLKNGFSIYKFIDDVNKQLIASPESGYLVDKPSLEIMVISEGEQ